MIVKLSADKKLVGTTGLKPQRKIRILPIGEILGKKLRLQSKKTFGCIWCHGNHKRCLPNHDRLQNEQGPNQKLGTAC